MIARFRKLAAVGGIASAAFGCANSPGANGPPASAAGEVAIHVLTTGSARRADVKLHHAADAQHYCTVSSQPWSHVVVKGESLEVPPLPPTYQVVYGAANDETRFHFSAFNYHAGMTAHSDPADDEIDLQTGEREWIGRGGSNDPAFQFEIKFTPDGNSGSFIAHHLRLAHDGQISPGNETADLQGGWRCTLGAVPAH
jgi:hypothetical protein